MALKILRPEVLASKLAVERFQREARTTAKMHHPHIVPVFDAGQHGEHLFIASALIPGCTLATAIPEGGMEPGRAVRFTIQLVEALAYAHKQGVLHRDVKPANILLDAADTLYLMDFGLAGWTEQRGDRLTKLGAIVGTPSYVAPEQARGDLAEVGPAADLYSAGVVLYELLTGRVPFDGPVPAIVHQVLNTLPPPPSQYRPGLDAQLEAICLKTLAKKPAERFASGQEMGDVLRRWLLTQEALEKGLLGQEPPPQLPQSRPTPRRQPAPPTMGGEHRAASFLGGPQKTVVHTPGEKPPPSTLWADELSEPSPVETTGGRPGKHQRRSRTARLLRTGTVVGGVIGLAVLVMLFTWLLRPSPDATRDTREKGPPPPELQALADVAMPAGEVHLLNVSVQRNGCSVPLLVKIEGVRALAARDGNPFRHDLIWVSASGLAFPRTDRRPIPTNCGFTGGRTAGQPAGASSGGISLAEGS